MTDHEVQGNAADIIDAVPRGTIVCLRDYVMKGRAAYAARLALRSRERGVRFIVAGDVALALKVGAWGVHMPEALVPASIIAIQSARRRGLKVTTPVHTAAAAAWLARRPTLCDAALIAPAFATRSHPGAPSLGPLGTAQLRQLLPIPAYALGGITPTTGARLAGIPLCGIAGIRFA